MTDAITAMDGIVSAMNALKTAAGAPLPQIPNPAESSAQTSSFSDLFNAAVDRLDNGVASADMAAKSFASGQQDVPLSDVMMSFEEAGLALQTAATVRDKVLAAYTNIMNMPV
jgi:flagellar hook-basal body complex protein FliE